MAARPSPPNVMVNMTYPTPAPEPGNNNNNQQLQTSFGFQFNNNVAFIGGERALTVQYWPGTFASCCGLHMAQQWLPLTTDSSRAVAIVLGLAVSCFWGFCGVYRRRRMVAARMNASGRPDFGARPRQCCCSSMLEDSCNSFVCLAARPAVLPTAAFTGRLHMDSTHCQSCSTC